MDIRGLYAHNSNVTIEAMNSLIFMMFNATVNNIPVTTYAISAYRH
jgi:hypothetical protein